MLTESEIIAKLRDYAEIFKTHIRNKNYHGAKVAYDRARSVAVFMELDQNTMGMLFGIRGERGATLHEGLFPEADVIKAYGECVRRGQTFENEPYRPIKKHSA